MFLKKTWFTTLLVMTAVFLLAACGSEDADGEKPADDNPVVDSGGPQDGSPDDIVPLSEALKEYQVWMETSNEPNRNSSIKGLYVFKDGELTSYTNITDDDKVRLEEMKDLTDEEIIEIVKEEAEYVTTGEYTLDIKLDDLGQSTEVEDIILTSGTEVHTSDLEQVADEYYNSSAWAELVDTYPDFDSYLSALKTGEATFPSDSDRSSEINGDEITFTRTLDGSSILEMEAGIVQQTIFDTTFSGLKIGEYNAVITRVDDSFVGFKMDDPDTKSKNVTIEEYE